MQVTTITCQLNTEGLKEGLDALKNEIQTKTDSCAIRIIFKKPNDDSQLERSVYYNNRELSLYGLTEHEAYSFRKTLDNANIQINTLNQGDAKVTGGISGRTLVNGNLNSYQAVAGLNMNNLREIFPGMTDDEIKEKFGLRN